MPCNSEGYDNTYDRLQEATRAACEMAKVLTKKQRGSLTSATQAWIERHEAEDRKRERQEKQEKEDKAQRKKALAKLSPVERRLLRLEI